jgi:hypothetical protein
MDAGAVAQALGLRKNTTHSRKPGKQGKVALS